MCISVEFHSLLPSTGLKFWEILGLPDSKVLCDTFVTDAASHLCSKSQRLLQPACVMDSVIHWPELGNGRQISCDCYLFLKYAHLKV